MAVENSLYSQNKVAESGEIMNVSRRKLQL